MIEFGVLGPLLAAEGRAVDDEALWNGGPPASARKTLQVYVMRLRRSLGSPPAADARPRRVPAR